MKRKHTPFSKPVFLLLWVLVHGVAWIVLLGVVNEVLWRIPLLSRLQRQYIPTTMVIALVPGILITLMQVYLLPRMYPVRITSWFWISVFGWLLGGFLPDVYQHYRFSGMYVLIPQFYWLLLCLPPAIFQWFRLRVHFQSAWLWLLACAAGSAGFSINLPGEEYRIISVLLAGMAQGIVTGVVMLILLSKPRLEADTHEVDTLHVGQDDALT